MMWLKLEDNIKMCIRELDCEYVKPITLFQDKINGWFFIVLMNFWVS
jgi:hypothetical protein